VSVKEKIIERFKLSPEQTVKELVHHVEASKQMVHHVLKSLLIAGRLEKYGKTPKTVYKWVKEHKLSEPSLEYQLLKKEEDQFLAEHFLQITELGEMLEGSIGFEDWCSKRNEPFQKTVTEFVKTKKKYLKYFEKDRIDGTKKMQTTYKDDAYLNAVYYLDFYAIERFGKTRLGTILHYAKQGQNKFLMRLMMREIKNRIEKIIKSEKIDAVAFVPPTIRREVQIMKYIQEDLNLSLPVIELIKISGIIPVPQKSLSKIEQRINNAKNSFAVTDMRSFNRVLLIDDAVGSGATLNEIALKVKQKGVGKKVIGLAVVGSFKGFDVITDI
jgi:hypothetical protein